MPWLELPANEREALGQIGASGAKAREEANDDRGSRQSNSAAESGGSQCDRPVEPMEQAVIAGKKRLDYPASFLDARALGSGGKNRMGGRSDLSLVVKVTNNCNMGCPYCYFRHNAKLDSHNRMSIEVMEKVVASLIELNEESACFIWHGGEPLLRGRDFFDRVVSAQHKCLRKLGKSISLSNFIQTNGTLLDDRWIEFFLQNDFHVGVSLDGPKELFVKNRGGSDEEFDLIANNVRRASSRLSDLSILAVVTEASVGHEAEIFEFFRDLGVMSWGFLPKVEKTPEECISPARYASFLSSMLDVWAESDCPGIQIREFDEALRGMMGQEMRVCHHRKECERYITVTPDGELYPCDCFPQNEKTKIGSLDDGLKAVSLSVEQFFAPSKQLPDGCLQCDLAQMCKGGCSFNRWIKGDGFRAQQLYCEAYKSFQGHLSELLGFTG